MKLTQHKKYLTQHKISPVNFALLITSDSRTSKTDLTGKTIVKLMRPNKCFYHEIIKNNLGLIRRKVRKFLTDPRVQLIITSGGTGCGRHDLTIEAVRSLLKKEIEGFGELFRLLSYKEIGSTAFMSRAMLGITKNGKIIASLPGSPNAVKLALTKLLRPELAHMLWEISR